MKYLKNKGMMGVGTLIIFIAVILVAAVAAAVLISMSGSLQQRGLATGQQSEGSVSTGLEPVAVTATDGSQNHDLENFELIMRIGSGSDPVNLNHTVMVVDTKTTSQNLAYNGTISSDTGSGVTTSDFRVYYIKQGPDYEAGYLSRGDVIKLKWKCYDCTGSSDTGGIGENRKVRIKVVPRIGNPALIEFNTPAVIKDNRIDVWP